MNEEALIYIFLSSALAHIQRDGKLWFSKNVFQTLGRGIVAFISNNPLVFYDFTNQSWKQFSPSLSSMLINDLLKMVEFIGNHALPGGKAEDHARSGEIYAYS